MGHFDSAATLLNAQLAKREATIRAGASAKKACSRPRRTIELQNSQSAFGGSAAFTMAASSACSSSSTSAAAASGGGSAGSSVPRGRRAANHAPVSDWQRSSSPFSDLM